MKCCELMFQILAQGKSNLSIFALSLPIDDNSTIKQEGIPPNLLLYSVP